MLEPIYTKQFQKDLKLLIKRGKNPQKLKNVMSILLDKGKLEDKHRDYFLRGNYAHRRECHIESDWLLIYQPIKKEIIFERTGMHSDLFK